MTKKIKERKLGFCKSRKRKKEPNKVKIRKMKQKKG
jgi:hypothetical protein